MEKKQKAEYWVIPKEMYDIADIAKERTKEIVRLWAHNPSNTVNQLAVSIYLQGMQDVIKVAFAPKRNK